MKKTIVKLLVGDVLVWCANFILEAIHDNTLSDVHAAKICDLKRGLRNHFDARRRMVK